MGKNKPMKPPHKGGGGNNNKGRSSSSSSFLDTLLVVGGILGAGVAVGAGIYFYLGGTVAGAEKLVTQAMRGDLKMADVGVGEISEREALQMGRAPKNGKRPQCLDRGAGCSSATAETCAADAALAKRCCRSCHFATCVDQYDECYDWSMQDQCLDNVEFMQKNCCFSCSPDIDDPCSLDPSSRPDVYKGDFNKTFERSKAILPQPYLQRAIHVDGGRRSSIRLGRPHCASETMNTAML